MAASSPPRAAETDTAPPSYGHRSQAIVASGFLFTGGVIGVPLDRGTGPREEFLASGTLDEQLDACLQHLNAITIAERSTPDRVVEIAAFVAEPDARAHLVRAIERFMGTPPPLVHYQEVEDVALHGLVELDWVVCVDDSMSTAEAAELIRPLGLTDTGSDVVPSGPFLITNNVLGRGADMTTATEHALGQIESRLAPYGGGLESILKMVVYIDEFDRYPDFNEVTQRLLTQPPLPTRSVIVAPLVTGDAAVRIDVVAQT